MIVGQMKRLRTGKTGMPVSNKGQSVSSCFFFSQIRIKMNQMSVPAQVRQQVVWFFPNHVPVFRHSWALMEMHLSESGIYMNTPSKRI